MDQGNLCLLSFLDLSSAFDTVDHDILLQRLQLSFGLTNSVLSWFRSFILGRSMSVRFSSVISAPCPLSCGVPQGSVLGPLLFVMYVADIIPLVQSFHLDVHMFADDLQIYGACSPSSTPALSTNLSLCLDSVISWLGSNRLLLNCSKSELMWCSSRRRKSSIPSSPIRVGSSLISPTPSVRCLGVLLDSELSFRSHVTRTVATCFSLLRQIKSIRRSLTYQLLTTVVSSLVLSRLDYCLTLLHGTPACHLMRLQRVLHTSARLIHRLPPTSHVSPVLRDL